MPVASTAPLLCTLPDPRPGAVVATKGVPARRGARAGIRALHLGATADTRSMRLTAVVQIRATRPVSPAHTVGTRLKSAAHPVLRPRPVDMDPRQGSGLRPTAHMAHRWRSPLPHRIRMALHNLLGMATSPLHMRRPRVGPCRRRADLMAGVLLEGASSLSLSLSFCAGYLLMYTMRQALLTICIAIISATPRRYDPANPRGAPLPPYAAGRQGFSQPGMSGLGPAQRGFPGPMQPQQQPYGGKGRDNSAHVAPLCSRQFRFSACFHSRPLCAAQPILCSPGRR
jgi:hypothetical protein